MLRDAAIAPDTPELHAALAAADLPTEDVAEAGRTFFRFEADGRTVGFAGYELYGEDLLLRSVVVMPEARGRGLGRDVTERILAHGRAAGARRAFLLTTGAEAFFTHTGFAAIDRAEAPGAILATRQATTICASAALLTREL